MSLRRNNRAHSQDRPDVQTLSIAFPSRAHLRLPGGTCAVPVDIACHARPWRAAWEGEERKGVRQSHVEKEVFEEKDWEYLPCGFPAVLLVLGTVSLPPLSVILQRPRQAQHAGQVGWVVGWLRWLVTVPSRPSHHGDA